MWWSAGEYYKVSGSPSQAQDRLIALQVSTQDRYYASIRGAVRAGVKVALGSDYVGWDPKITGVWCMAFIVS